MNVRMRVMKRYAVSTTAAKKELGDVYGMGTYAPAGEWKQQIAAMEAHLAGKTLSGD